MIAPATLLLIDCQPLFLEGMIGALRRAWPELAVLTATDFRQACAILGKQDVEGVLANWETLQPGEIGELIQMAAPAPVIATSNGAEESLVSAAFAAGARGFLPKTMGGDAVKSAIVVALSGGACFPNQSLVRLTDVGRRPSARFQGQRQIEVLDRLARGMSNKQIARELGLSVATVKLHVQSILRSTGSRSRFEAVGNARRMGLLPPAA
jgi:DNA-binding NarL/FixJ family response regulator